MFPPNLLIISQVWRMTDLPLRAFRFPIPLIKGVAEAALYCVHRKTSLHLIDLSTLACFSFPGRALMLVYVRPSNEALLIPHRLQRG